MAVLDDKKTKVEPVLIDPANFTLANSEAMEMDLEADAYERAAPPPAGRYDLHFTPSEKCYELRKTDDGTEYVVANLEGRIVNCPNEELNGTMVFARVSTFLGRGKKISTMAYVLLKMGYPKEKLSGAITPNELVNKFSKFLIKQDRVVKDCLLDWQGWSQLQEKVVYSKMADFPKGPDGKHLHIVDYRKMGNPSEEITAKLKLKDWGGSSGAPGAAKAPTSPAKAPVVVKRSAVVAAAPEEDEDAPAPAPKAKAKAPAQPSKAEVDALLDGDDE